MADQKRLRELYRKLRELEAESDLAKKYRAEIRYLHGLRRLYSDDPIPDQYIYRAKGIGGEDIELTMPLWLRAEFKEWVNTKNPNIGKGGRRPCKALKNSKKHPDHKMAKFLAIAFVRAKVQEHSEALVAHVYSISQRQCQDTN